MMIDFHCDYSTEKACFGMMIRFFLPAWNKTVTVNSNNGSRKYYIITLIKLTENIRNDKIIKIDWRFVCDFIGKRFLYGGGGSVGRDKIH